MIDTTAKRMSLLVKLIERDFAAAWFSSGWKKYEAGRPYADCLGEDERAGYVAAQSDAIDARQADTVTPEDVAVLRKVPA